MVQGCHSYYVIHGYCDRGLDFINRGFISPLRYQTPLLQPFSQEQVEMQKNANDTSKSSILARAKQEYIAPLIQISLRVWKL